MTLEYLASVPVDMGGGRQLGSRPGLELEFVEVVDGTTDSARRGIHRRHDDGPLINQSEDTSIKKLVMQGAQSQSVVHVVRPFEVEPPDVGRLNADGTAASTSVEAAECA